MVRRELLCDVRPCLVKDVRARKQMPSLPSSHTAEIRGTAVRISRGGNQNIRIQKNPHSLHQILVELTLQPRGKFVCFQKTVQLLLCVNLRSLLRVRQERVAQEPGYAGLLPSGFRPYFFEKRRLNANREKIGCSRHKMGITKYVIRIP